MRGRTRVNIRGGRFSGFGVKTRGTSDMRGGRFAGLGLKTRGTSSAAGWWLQRARGVIVKLASRRNEFVKAACLLEALRKSWTVLFLRGIWVVCLMDGVLIFSQCVYIERVSWLRELTLSKPLGRLSF